MALIKCPECGNEVSDSAKRCPHCGFLLKKQIMLKIVLSIVLAIILTTLIAILATNNFMRNIPDFKSNIAVDSTAKPLYKIELNSNNILNYIDISISCEDFKQDNVKKDFLGFTDYYYSANAHIKISPKKGEKFENVQIDIKYKDDDLYGDLYYSLGTVSINLNQDGNGETTQSMNYSLMTIPYNSPKMESENIEIVGISGYVYDNNEPANDLYSEGETTITGVIARIKWIHPNETLHTAYILKLNKPVNVYTENSLYTNIDEIQLCTSNLDKKYVGKQVKVKGNIKSDGDTVYYIRDVFINDPEIEILDTQQQDAAVNDYVSKSDCLGTANNIHYTEIEQGALEFAQNFFHEKFVLEDEEPYYENGVYWIYLDWDDGTIACSVKYDAKKNSYAMGPSCWSLTYDH
ncbi:MAG: zinc ribbon domain-containing protein [Clostridia bacterium]